MTYDERIDAAAKALKQYSETALLSTPGVPVELALAAIEKSWGNRCFHVQARRAVLAFEKAGGETERDDYISLLAGVVALPDYMSGTLLSFGRRVRLAIVEEQAKPNPDNALIAILCDAVRLGWERGKGAL